MVLTTSVDPDSTLNRQAITRGELAKIHREDQEMRARGVEPFTGVSPETPEFAPAREGQE
jgi:hypothetical protein